MKLWLLDADVIIKLLEIDIFDKLDGLHSLHVASTVVDEVKYFRRSGQKFQVDFRQQYIESGRVVESTASVEKIQEILSRLPPLRQKASTQAKLSHLLFLSNSKTSFSALSMLQQYGHFPS